MANKTLTQALGNAAREIGDVINTRRKTNLTPGNVLLDADGTAINDVTYPLLAAELDPGAFMSGWEIPYTSAGTTICDGKQLENVGSLFVTENDLIHLIDANQDLNLQTLSAISSSAQTENGWGNIAASADGNEVVAACNSANGTNDLKLFYTTAGGLPTSTLNLETADVFTASGRTFAIINRAGTSAKVMAVNGTDSTYDMYSSGANVGTGWSLDFGYSYTTVPGLVIGPPAWTDDLNSVILALDNGIWITTDGGSSWAETILLPDTSTLAVSVAVDSTDNFYAIDTSGPKGTNRLFKSSNAGTNWTEILNVHEALQLLNVSADSTLDFVSVDTDNSDNLYVTANLLGPGVITPNGLTFVPVALFYSEDGGTTWAGNVMHTGGTTQDPDYLRILDAAPDTIFVTKDGSQIYFAAEQTSNSTIFQADITTGKILPYAPGHKVVADPV